MEKMLDIRYPPYAGKIEKFRKMSELKPNFDRNGNEIKGLGYWLAFLGVLGGPSFKAGLVRWALVAVVAFGANKYLAAGRRLPPWLR
jgi:beta-apo-4'-carotenal oxygenase